MECERTLWGGLLIRGVLISFVLGLTVLFFPLLYNFGPRQETAYLPSSFRLSSCNESTYGDGTNTVCYFSSLYQWKGRLFASLDFLGSLNVSICFPYTDSKVEGRCIHVHDISLLPPEFNETAAIVIDADLTVMIYRLGVEVFSHSIIDGLFVLYHTARLFLPEDRISTGLQAVFLDLHNTVLGNRYDALWSSATRLLPKFIYDERLQMSVFRRVVIGNYYRLSKEGGGRDLHRWRDFAKYMSLLVLGYDAQQIKKSVLLLNRSPGKDTRTIENEWELTKALRSAGFHVVAVQPGVLKLSQQILLVRTAQFIVGPHGSNLASLAFVNDNTTLIEIQPDGMQSPWFQTFCNFSNIRYFTGAPFDAIKYEKAANIQGAFYKSFECNVSYIMRQLSVAVKNLTYNPTCTTAISNRVICE